MEMFGHYHVADYDEAILLPGALQDRQKQVTALAAAKLRTPPITTAGYEMQVVPTISALQTSRHAPKKYRGQIIPVCDGTYRKL